MHATPRNTQQSPCFKFRIAAAQDILCTALNFEVEPPLNCDGLPRLLPLVLQGSP